MPGEIIENDPARRTRVRRIAAVVNATRTLETTQRGDEPIEQETI